MSRRIPPRNLPPQRPMSRDPRPFWLLSVARTLVLAIAAAIFATFVFFLLVQVSQLPHGALWDPSFRKPLLFVMLIVVIGVLLVPFFQGGADWSLRTFVLFAVPFIVVYAVLQSMQMFDPELPMRFASTHVFAPFRRWLGF